MDVQREVLLLQFEQLDKSIWDDIIGFAAKWNRTKHNKFINDEPSELAIYFSGEDDKELKELENILEQKHEERGWAWNKTIPHDPTVEEIEAHDYIQIIGDGYPDEFLLNESNALSPTKPCEACGTIHSYSRTQKEALQVNEAFLDRKNTYPNYLYAPPGLDLVNMPHGALLVSRRVLELIKQNRRLYGCTFWDVINQEGKVSDRLFQLVADKVILLSDNLPSEGAICPTCGTVLSTLTRGFSIRKGRLGGASVFARSPSGTAFIYVSNALYHMFKSENVRGLTPARGTDLIND